MARGVRTNATLLPTLSPVLQPQSIAAYDPVTRRNTILVATIVPTLAEADSLKSAHFLADRYYCVVGALQSTSAVPDWMGGATNITFEQWDATDKQFYARFAATASAGYIGDSVAPRFIYPVGLYGTATSHAPKNADVAAVWIKFTARFNVNTDYTVYGVGASSAQDFATGHFLQVTRNSGSWELTTRDGSTTSTSSDVSADGDLHDFGVRWSATDVKLYVDGTLTITKSTNLPAQPLATGIYAENSTNTIDVVDYLIEWELA
jgi:hypothetical protein